MAEPALGFLLHSEQNPDGEVCVTCTHYNGETDLTQYKRIDKLTFNFVGKYVPLRSSSYAARYEPAQASDIARWLNHYKGSLKNLSIFGPLLLDDTTGRLSLDDFTSLDTLVIDPMYLSDEREEIQDYPQRIHTALPKSIRHIKLTYSGLPKSPEHWGYLPELLPRLDKLESVMICVVGNRNEAQMETNIPDHIRQKYAEEHVDLEVTFEDPPKQGVCI